MHDNAAVMAELADRPPLLSADAALLLDFDGTLVEIAPRPDAVTVAPALPVLLQSLAASLDGAVAVVSGRPLREIDRLLHPVQLAGAGLHGGERRLHGAAIERMQPLPSIPSLLAALRHHFAEDSRILVEDKQLSVALHYRLAPERAEECRQLMSALVTDPQLEILPGSMVLEARPRSTHKGAAVRALLAQAPFSGRRPVFVGDDVTDEDGFRAALELDGLAVKVGPGASAASFRCGTVPEVHDWLRRSLARLQDKN